MIDSYAMIASVAMIHMIAKRCMTLLYVSIGYTHMCVDNPCYMQIIRRWGALCRVIVCPMRLCKSCGVRCMRLMCVVWG